MKFAVKSQANKFVASDECTVYEYPLGSQKASSTTTQITGRYPLQGWARNDVCDELAYVLSGTGKLLTPEKSYDLQPGDTALIEQGNLFAWEGKDLEVFIPCFPAWSPEQHKLITE